MSKLQLIFVPGLLCTADLWRDQLPALADLVDPVVTMAHTKHDNLVEIAAEIIRDAAPIFALAGLSMGGYVALEIMRQAPDRVARLALLDTAARADSVEQRQRRQDFMKLASMGKFRGVTPQLMPMLVHADRLTDEKLTGRILRMAEDVGSAAFLRQQAAIMGRPDSRPGLADIRCPTLVLCGDSDRLTPPERSEEMAMAIPGAELRILPRCGHMAPMEWPDRVNAELRQWLGTKG